jgi:hypothetical protein
MSHVIRLRAAWNRSNGSEETRVNLPDETTVTSECDRVVYRRSFNAPTSISGATPIFFGVSSWIGELSLILDGTTLVQKLEYAGQPLRIDLTGLLRHHHQAEITLRSCATHQQSPQDSHVGLTGSCYLEIA